MRRIPLYFALACLAVAPGRPHGQEPPTVIRIGADVSGAPCTISGSDTDLLTVDEMVRQLRSAVAGSETVPLGSLARCSPETPPLSKVALGHGTAHFDVRGWTVDLPVEELGALLEEIHEYVSERTGLRIEGLIPVMLQPANVGACPRRGRAWHSGIELFVENTWSHEQWRAVLAHELAHVLQIRESPGIGRLGLGEGYASWSAGRYWTDWQGHASLTAAVLDYRERGVFIDLSTSGSQVGFQEDPESTTPCLAQRDIVYTEWASLVEYLIESYGREGFYERAESAPELRPGGIDYSGIFDRSLAQIEADWLAAIRAQR